jgi:hypothetical protein
LVSKIQSGLSNGSFTDEACMGETNCGKGFLGMSRQNLFSRSMFLALRHQGMSRQPRSPGSVQGVEMGE